MSKDLDQSRPWLDALCWDKDGLVPVIAQGAQTAQVMMFAWANREALEESARTGYAVYFSRSRGRLWRKGEESGHRQAIAEIRTDCDGDVVLYRIEQEGGIACHTGRRSCFFNRLVPDSTSSEGGRWEAADPVLKDPKDIYK